MEETVNLQEIFNLLKKKVTLIVLMFFIGIGISALVTFIIITPKYNAVSQLIATSQNKDSNVSTDNINSNLLMINTYKDFIKGRVVTEAVREELEKEINFKGSSEDVKNMINVEQAQNSQMFSIVVTSTSPEEAADVANIAAEIFKKEASEYTEADKVSIISAAEVPQKPISPNKQINLAIGGILGIIFGIGLILLSQLFNRKVQSVDYLTENLNIPVLGRIPIVTSRDLEELQRNQKSALKNASKSVNVVDTNFSFEEEIDGLDLDIQRINEGKGLEKTSDLSEININRINLDDMGSSNKYRNRIN